ncbi:MAG: Flp family type IVb pilin [Nitrospirales bacterium]|nr:Flp family type IVb pilin [Nitrospirales bacterium]
MVNQIMRFVKEDEGATAIEYGLLAALIAAVIVGAVTALGNNVNTAFTNVAAGIAGS